MQERALPAIPGAPGVCCGQSKQEAEGWTTESHSTFAQGCWAGDESLRAGPPLAPAMTHCFEHEIPRALIVLLL